MPITEYALKPWRVACDTCGEYLGSEDYGGPILCDTREVAEETVRDWSWRLVDGVVTCEECQEEERLAAVEGDEAAMEGTDA